MDGSSFVGQCICHCLVDRNTHTYVCGRYLHNAVKTEMMNWTFSALEFIGCCQLRFNDHHDRNVDNGSCLFLQWKSFDRLRKQCEKKIFDNKLPSEKDMDIKEIEWL